MLLISRKLDQAIDVYGRDGQPAATIKVVRIERPTARRPQVMLGVEAAASVAVVRGEVPAGDGRRQRARKVAGDSEGGSDGADSGEKKERRSKILRVKRFNFDRLLTVDNRR